MSPAATPREWSAPDEGGVETLYATSSRMARRRRAPGGRRSVETLQGPYRDLTVRLLALGGAAVKGKTLYAKASNDRHVAVDTADYLLREGWAELSEKRSGSLWTVVELSWIDPDELREQLRLPRRDEKRAARERALSAPPLDDRLLALHESLSSITLKTLLRRAATVAALDRWCLAQRTGTRAQFAQAELGDTKALTSSDWRWIEKHADLEAVGVSRHTPALWLRGPLRCLIDDEWVNIGRLPDMLALTPRTLAAIRAIELPPPAWLLVENRTSFEDVARRLGDRYAVLWMPGFVPDWWLTAVEHLIRLAGGPAFISADPDPAGIDIALRASRPWNGRWTPWAMSAEALAGIERTKPLNAYDRDRLAAQTGLGLPDELLGLHRALQDRGRKGEQEALDLPAWLPI